MTKLTDSELESQLRSEEFLLDALGDGIPEYDINPHEPAYDYEPIEPDYTA